MNLPSQGADADRAQGASSKRVRVPWQALTWGPFRAGDVLGGMLIYASGDTVASLLLDQASLTRLLTVMLVGGLVYSVEIPAYFRFIDRRAKRDGTGRTAVVRALLALLYFNPLWIGRHLLLLKLGQPAWEEINLHLAHVALLSFAGNIPLSFVGNLTIQNAVPHRLRFVASALFSAAMAVYYAASSVWFA